MTSKKRFYFHCEGCSWAWHEKVSSPETVVNRGCQKCGGLVVHDG